MILSSVLIFRQTSKSEIISDSLPNFGSAKIVYLMNNAGKMFCFLNVPLISICVSYFYKVLFLTLSVPRSNA